MICYNICLCCIMAEINRELICMCMYVCLCTHPFAHAWTCQGMRLESEPYKQQSFLAVIDDASVAYCLENQRHINAGQRRQDVLTGYVMRMTIKGMFCCLWIPLRCLQSWLRVQAFSAGHVTHDCFFFHLIFVHNYCFCSMMCNCDLGCDTM